MPGLSDADLECSGQIAAAGGDLTTEHRIENIILRNAGEYFVHVKAATGA